MLNLSLDDATSFAVICYELWFEFNKLRFEGKDITPQALLVSTDLQISLFYYTNMDGPRRPTHRQTPSSFDLRSCSYSMKFTDGAISSPDNLHTTGTFMCDNKWAFIAASAHKYYGSLDALSAEALAARDGIRLAKRIGIRSFVLLSDSSKLIGQLQQPMEDEGLSIKSPLLQDTGTLYLHSMF